MTLDPENIRATLAGLGQKGLTKGDLGETALLLASLSHPEIQLDPYRDHLAALATTAKQTIEDNPEAALRRAIAVEFGYDGDQSTYDDLQNANLIRVIDRRKEPAGRSWHSLYRNSPNARARDMRPEFSRPLSDPTAMEEWTRHCRSFQWWNQPERPSHA